MVHDRSTFSFAEKIYRFGKNDRLVGVVSEPVKNTYNSGVAAVLLNSGLLHRVGIQRVGVDISRTLAKAGITAFRVDLYGIGESSSQSGIKSFRDRAFDDIQESLDFLERKTGIERFVLIGHCAGADNAHNVVVKDERVVGGVFLDGFGYPTLGFKLRDIGGPCMVDPVKWVKYVTKKSLRFFLKKRDKQNFMEIFGRYWPERHDAEKQLDSAMRRGAKLLYIYSGGVPVYYNHGAQFRSMFPSLKDNEKVQTHYFSKADHNFTEVEYRNAVVDLIERWMKNSFLEN